VPPPPKKVKKQIFIESDFAKKQVSESYKVTSLRQLKQRRE